MKGHDWVVPLAVSTALAFAAVNFLAGVVGSLKSLLVMLVTSVFISFAMEPVVGRLARRGWRRGMAAGVLLVGVAVSMVGVIVVMGALVVAQGADLLDDIPGIVEDSANWLSATFNINVDVESVLQDGGALDQVTANVESRVSGDGLLDTSNQLGAATGAVLATGFFSFYFSADGPRIRRALCRLAPPTRQQHVLRLFEVAVEKAGGYMLARFILAAVSAAAHGAMFAAIGVPYPLPLALWMGVISQMIPVVGTYLGATAPVVFALTVSPGVAIAVLVAIVLYQQVENLALAPRIVGNTVNIHPIVGFASVLAAAVLVGVIGALIAVPIVATIQGFVATFWSSHELSEDLDEQHDLLRP